MTDFPPDEARAFFPANGYMQNWAQYELMEAGYRNVSKMTKTINLAKLTMAVKR
jgi:hypothetical protein